MNVSFPLKRMLTYEDNATIEDGKEEEGDKKNKKDETFSSVSQIPYKAIGYCYKKTKADRWMNSKAGRLIYEQFCNFPADSICKECLKASM